MSLVDLAGKWIMLEGVGLVKITVAHVQRGPDPDWLKVELKPHEHEPEIAAKVDGN